MKLAGNTGKTLLLMCFLLLTGSVFIYSQNKSELEKKKAENIEQLRYTREILDKMTSSRKASLSEINLIERSISTRENLVGNISEQIGMIERDIVLNNDEISRINLRIEDIKKNYATLIKSSYKLLDDEYALMYILSSEDINQGYQRIKYVRYLTEYRKKLVSALDSEKVNIIRVNKNLSESKAKNEKLLGERKQEISKLDRDKKRRLVVVNDLKKKESDLRKEIQRREKVMVQIELEMKKIIEEEARKARDARNANTMTPTETILAAEFSGNKGKLPWPTEKGVVTIKYGKQNHSVLRGIEYDSPGIDITTVNGSTARAVFSGEVTKVVAIMGANYTVIIRHGNYYSVYQNLINVRVKAGDKVNTGDQIGVVFTDLDNISRIHFQLWKDKSTLNPELWLKL
jgi:murein hydrolase activator